MDPNGAVVNSPRADADRRTNTGSGEWLPQAVLASSKVCLQLGIVQRGIVCRNVVLFQHVLGPCLLERILHPHREGLELRAHFDLSPQPRVKIHTLPLDRPHAQPPTRSALSHAARCATTRAPTGPNTQIHNYLTLSKVDRIAVPFTPSRCGSSRRWLRAARLVTRSPCGPSRVPRVLRT